MNPGTVDLLARILRGLPSLPTAACRGKHHLFDPVAPGEQPDAVAERHAQALSICDRCPELPACRRWRDSLPRSRIPAGVIAGTVNQPSPARRKHA